MTKTILQMCNITVHSFQVHGHYSFFHFRGHFFSRPWTLFLSFTSVDTIPFTSVDTISFFLFLGDRSLYLVTSLSTWVSTPPVVSTWLIPSGRACRGVAAHHVCSTYVSAPQVQPPVPADTYNTVSMSLSSYLAVLLI